MNPPHGTLLCGVLLISSLTVVTGSVISSITKECDAEGYQLSFVVRSYFAEVQSVSPARCEPHSVETSVSGESHLHRYTYQFSGWNTTSSCFINGSTPQQAEAMFAAVINIKAVDQTQNGNDTVLAILANADFLFHCRHNSAPTTPAGPPCNHGGVLGVPLCAPLGTTQEQCAEQHCCFYSIYNVCLVPSDQ